MTQNQGKSEGHPISSIHDEAGRPNDVVDRGVAAADDALVQEDDTDASKPDLHKAEHAGREGGSR